ncbi:hypothetical protein ACFL5Q_01460 [Planctomycetota bacterium]
MFIPIPMVISPESAPLEDRVRRLEQALVLSLEALQSVVERLESKFGHEFLGTDLQHLTAAGSDADLQGILESIDRSLTAGEKPAAARQFREAFGCTWDQAHHAIGQWRSHSPEPKLRWLRLARYIKTLETAEPT